MFIFQVSRETQQAKRVVLLLGVRVCNKVYFTAETDWAKVQESSRWQSALIKAYPTLHTYCVVGGVAVKIQSRN